MADKLTSFLVRGVLFAALWWIIADGAPSSWWIGVPAVLLATGISVLLVPPFSLVLWELLRFVPLFLVKSLMGGVDVGRRAFQPEMGITPDLVEYPLRLPPGIAAVFMSNVVSVLPGTLSAELDEHTLTVHVFDTRKPFLQELEVIEESVARLFGVPLQDRKA